MKKLFQHLLILGIFSITGLAQVVVKYQDYVTKGNTQVVSGGVGSTNRVVGSFPSSTVAVYLTGTVTLATIYSDASLTPKSNPLTATSEGYYEFYIVAGTYDIRFSGTGITTPFTRSAVEILGNSIPQYTTAGKPVCTVALLNRQIRLTDGARGTASCVPYGSGYEWVRDSSDIDLVRDFAVTGNCSTDDTVNAQAAVTAAQTYGYAVYTPTVTCIKLTDTLTYYQSGNGWGKPLRFRGDGSRRTIFKMFANARPVLSIRGGAATGGLADISEGNIRDFGIAQNSGQTTVIGLRIQGVTRTDFSNIEITGMSGGGLQIYATGGTGDSDLVSHCRFSNILSLDNTGSGFFVTAPSASIAFAQSYFWGCYAQGNTVAGWNLANYDGITIAGSTSVTNNTSTGIGIKDTYNGIFNRNLTLLGNELGNGNGRASVQLDRVVSVLSQSNRSIRNDGETGDYGVEFLSGGTVYNYTSQNDYFVVGAAIATFTAYQTTGTLEGCRTRAPYFNGTFTGGVVKVSDTTKLSIEDDDTITDTRTTMGLGQLTVAAGNFRVDSSGNGYFASNLSVGSTSTSVAKTYLTSATAGLSGFRFSGINNGMTLGLNGTSANYYDSDTHDWRSGNAGTNFATMSSSVWSLLLPQTITSASANALAVGANGTTNPVLKVNANTASVATGVQVTGAAAGAGVAVAAISSGTNESLQLSGKGTGLVLVGDTGTTTAVAGVATLNTQRGAITTEALTTAAGASYTLTLTNSKISSGNLVFPKLANGTNTAGTPIIDLVTEGSGSVVIVVRNSHAANAFNGTIVIKFIVY